MDFCFWVHLGFILYARLIQLLSLWFLHQHFFSSFLPQSNGVTNHVQILTLKKYWASVFFFNCMGIYHTNQYAKFFRYRVVLVEMHLANLKGQLSLDYFIFVPKLNFVNSFWYIFLPFKQVFLLCPLKNTNT